MAAGDSFSAGFEIGFLRYCSRWRPRTGVNDTIDAAAAATAGPWILVGGGLTIFIYL